MRKCLLGLCFLLSVGVASVGYAMTEEVDEQLAPVTTVTVVTKCKLHCDPSNETYTLLLIQSPSLRKKVATLYAQQFPAQEANVKHMDWESRLAMPGVVTFDATTKIVTFTVAAETFEIAQQINHTYVDLCRRTIEENNRVYVERTSKAITAAIQAEIAKENKRLETLLDAPASTRVKLQREESIKRLKTLNDQLQYARDKIQSQTTTLQILPRE